MYIFIPLCIAKHITLKFSVTVVCASGFNGCLWYDSDLTKQDCKSLPEAQSTAARAFKIMLGKVEVLCFNRNESNINNIKFSDLMAAQKYEKKIERLSYLRSTLRTQEKKKKERKKRDKSTLML